MIFENDPAGYFHDSLEAATHMPHHKLEELQLSALKRRFDMLRNALPPVKAVADVAGVDSIETFDDVAPLLLPHTIYKSYPPELLDHRRFDAMTKWTSRLTTHDLSALNGIKFHSIDAWLDAMDARTQVYMLHSSGTMGALSFMPRGREEVAASHRYLRAIGEFYRDPRNPWGAPVVWPGHGSGRQASMRVTDYFINVVAGSRDDFYALIDYPMSADMQYYQIRMSQARSSEERAAVEVTPHIREELERRDRLQQTIRSKTDEFLERVAREVKGRRVAMAGGPVQIYRFAKEAVDKGYRRMFAPGTTISLFGGAKGIALPDDWLETVREFAGDPTFIVTYGMTELCVGSLRCEKMRFHPHPALIPFVLDVDSGQPLPREGVQRGRAAYFDLMARSYWGGVVSADKVEIDWSPCACGRTSPHFSEEIERIDDDRETRTQLGAISGAGARAALSALNADLY